MRLYSITKGQVVTLVVFGVAGWFYSFVDVVDSYDPSPFLQFCLFAIPAFLFFYIIGWKNSQKKKEEGHALFFTPKLKSFLKNILSKFKSVDAEIVEVTAETHNEVIKDTVAKESLEGLGGWLTLVCLGLVASVLINIVGFFSEISSLSGLDDYPLLQGTVFFENLAQFLFIVFGIYLLYIFSKKKKKFPQRFIVYMVVTVVYGVIDYMLVSSIISSYPQIQNEMQSGLSELGITMWRSVIAALIWGSYMKKSKRVRLTFTE